MEDPLRKFSTSTASKNQLRPEVKSQMVPATTSLTLLFRVEKLYARWDNLGFWSGNRRNANRNSGRTRTKHTLEGKTWINSAWQAFRYDMEVPRSVMRTPTQYPGRNSPVRQKKEARPQIVRKPSKLRLKQGLSAGLLSPSGKSNLSAATPLSVLGCLQSYTEAKMLRDIEETFRTLRKINMKLNPKKCMFGAVEGMFLGYTITPEGIKPCPNKTEDVLQLPSPWTIKEVKSLNGKLASLNRFLSKSVEKSLPLFKTLKKCIKKSDFHWTSEAEQAFMQLKQHLSELPLLVAPKPKEELIIYLPASYGAVSAVLMTKRGMVQTPVYFIRRALQGPELNYTPIEKLVLSLVFTAKRLRRAAIKVERHARRTQYNVTAPRSGAGLILTSPEGMEFTYALRFQFTAYTMRQEYEALIACLRFAHLSKQVLVEILKEKSIQEEEVATVIEEEETTWMTPITEYLKDGTLPGERKEASKLRKKAWTIRIVERVLYKCSFLEAVAKGVS
ncbi:reverse transcriptase domain-containing protein [Tanacetum coccineum]